MKFLIRMLTWWNSQTLGTQIFTARRGIKVGTDAQGLKTNITLGNNWQKWMTRRLSYPFSQPV